MTQRKQSTVIETLKLNQLMTTCTYFQILEEKSKKRNSQYHILSSESM